MSYYKNFFKDIVKQYKNDNDIVTQEDRRKIINKLYGALFEQGNPWLNNGFQSYLHYLTFDKQEPLTVNNLKIFMKGIK